MTCKPSKSFRRGPPPLSALPPPHLGSDWAHPPVCPALLARFWWVGPGCPAWPPVFQKKPPPPRPPRPPPPPPPTPPDPRPAPESKPCVALCHTWPAEGGAEGRSSSAPSRGGGENCPRAHRRATARGRLAPTSALSLPAPRPPSPSPRLPLHAPGRPPAPRPPPPPRLHHHPQRPPARDPRVAAAPDACRHCQRARCAGRGRRPARRLARRGQDHRHPLRLLPLR